MALLAFGIVVQLCLEVEGINGNASWDSHSQQAVLHTRFGRFLGLFTGCSTHRRKFEDSNEAIDSPLPCLQGFPTR